MFKTLQKSVLLVLFFSSLAFAQSGSLSGKISDSVTGEEIPGATVYIVELQKGDAADMDGNYTISSIPNGSYTLQVSFVGYKKKTVSVSVSGSTTLDVMLDEDIAGLEEIIVTGQGQAIETNSLLRDQAF